MENASSALIIAMIGVWLIYIVIMTLLIAYKIVCLWFIFKKAGEKEWKVFIPVYNLITFYKIVGLSPYLIFIYCASVIPVVGYLVPLTMQIIENIWLGKAFKKDPGFIVGLALLPAVFEGILAFGRSEYGLNKAKEPIEIKE